MKRLAQLQGIYSTSSPKNARLRFHTYPIVSKSAACGTIFKVNHWLWIRTMQELNLHAASFRSWVSLRSNLGRVCGLQWLTGTTWGGLQRLADFYLQADLVLFKFARYKYACTVSSHPPSKSPHFEDVHSFICHLRSAAHNNWPSARSRLGSAAESRRVRNSAATT